MCRRHNPALTPLAVAGRAFSTRKSTEREGFEPPIRKAYSGFRDRPVQPDSGTSPQSNCKSYVLSYREDSMMDGKSGQPEVVELSRFRKVSKRIVLRATHTIATIEAFVAGTTSNRHMTTIITERRIPHHVCQMLIQSVGLPNNDLFVSANAPLRC